MTTKEKLQELGLSEQTIKNYLSGEWGIPEQIRIQLSKMEDENDAQPSYN